MKLNQQRINLQAVIDYLAQEGFTEVKKGGFAQVYLNPKENYCYKIFTYDPHYIHFVNFCIDNPRNPFLPKIDNFVHFSYQNFYVVKMEKLSPFNYFLSTEKAFNLSCKYEDLLKAWQKQKHKHFNHHLHQLMEQLFQLTKEGKLSDIHMENLMFRERQVVFIDPIGY